MKICSINEERWNENVSFLFQTVNYARLQSNPKFLKFGNKHLLYTTRKINLPFLGLSTSIVNEAVTILYPTEKPLDKRLLDRYIEHCNCEREIPIIITDQKLPYLELYPWGTIMLELDEDYKDKISWDAKKGIKQAIKKNVEVVELKKENEWKEFLEIGKHIRIRKNLRAPFMTPDYFRKCFEDQGFVRLMGAYVGHELIAGGLFFAAKKYIRYIRGATYERYYDYFPTHLILWKMIEWGKKNGYQYFDLGGYHIGAKRGTGLWGINVFKRQWGALFLRRRYVGAFLLDDKSWRLLGGIFRYMQYALSEGIFKTKDKREFKKCLEKIAEEKAKLERIKYEASELLGVREEYLQSRAIHLYHIWKKIKRTNNKNVGLSLNKINLSELEKNYKKIVELTSKNLKTQDKYLIKTLRNFTREILLKLLRENIDDLRKYGELDIKINNLVDRAEEYDKPLRIIEDLKMKIRNYQGEKKQDLIKKIKKFSIKTKNAGYIEKRNECLDELLNVLHENNLYLILNMHARDKNPELLRINQHIIRNEGYLISLIDDAKNTVIAGKRIYLRGLKEEDVSQEYCNWLNDPLVNKFLETKKATIDELKQYVKEKKENLNCLFLGIFLKDKDKHIGNIKLEPIDLKNKEATLGILIGDKNYWGRGICAEAASLLVDYAFKKLKLKKIDLGVIPENRAAIKCYLKAGFRIDEIKREIIENGKSYDEVIMSIENYNVKTKTGGKI